MITDASGNIKGESDFYPYGGEVVVVADSTANHYKFTGKERDPETGVDYFFARYYSSALGRFLTPDWSATPVPVPYASLGDPQSLNLYSYVENNPITGIDPDGHMASAPFAMFDSPNGNASCVPDCEGVDPTDADYMQQWQIDAMEQQAQQAQQAQQQAQNQVTPQTLRDQIPADVRATMAAAITDSDSPSGPGPIGDYTGGFHEEYGVAGLNASGGWVVSRDGPGRYANPDTDDHVSPSGRPANQAVANSIVNPKVFFHVHPRGVTAKGNGWKQPPQGADLRAAVSGKINIVFGARDHKVYFYNSTGIIGKPMKLKDFLNQ